MQLVTVCSSRRLVLFIDEYQLLALQQVCTFIVFYIFSQSLRRLSYLLPLFYSCASISVRT